MSSEWTLAPLEECLDALIDYRGKTPEKTSFGIPLITAKIIKNGRIEKPTEFIAVDNYDSWMRRGIPLEGDVVLTVEAPLGEVAQLGAEKIALAQRVVTLRGKKGLLDNTYLLYLLQTEEMLDQLKARATGTTVLGIKQSELRKVQLSLPPIDQQIAAARILRALDDRITLLRETNATLEAIAQALFKSWFVDFDPVRAKAEGRARQDGERSGQPRMPQASDLPRPGAEAGAEAQGQPEAMDATTAALFPDSFEESELGLVPKGWEVLPLRQLCAFQKGCSYKGDGLADGEGAYMFNLGCFNEPRVYAFQKVKRYVGDYKPKHQVYPGDLIIANTDMTQQRDILGRPLLVPSGMEPGFISHHVFKVEVGERFGSQIRDFLFFSFQQAVFRERAVGYATGTTVLALPRDALEEHCVVLPSQSLLMAFSDVVSPLLAAIHENEERATLLTQLRDTLLPRLISGQLRLPEAEATVEEVL